MILIKKSFFVPPLLFVTVFVLAQKNEIGGMIGTANLISDIGKDGFIQSPIQKSVEGNTDVQFFVSGIYKRNFNSRIGARAQVSYAHVVGNDLKSNEPSKQARGLGYDNNIIELALMMEYNLFHFNHSVKTAFSPYIFAGVAVMSHKNRNYELISLTQADVKEEYNAGMTFPFGAGLKYKFNYNWVFAFEIGFRPTKQDDIDYSNPDKDDVSAGSGISEETALSLLTFGQSGNKDWYVFSGIGLTYTFGRAKCYRN